jgi:thiamine-monophosphate kinase
MVIPAGGDEPGRLTEDELVAELRLLLAEDAPGVVLGPGDDAALVELGDRQGVLTTDLMVEGVHFLRETVTAADLGYKALVVNVSDVAAMGGSPRFALVSLGLPSDVEAPWVVELYGGLRAAAAEYATAIVGGDTSRADRIVISIAVVGEVMPGGAILRSGATPGDAVVVTGSLGASAGGLVLSRADAHVVAQAVSDGWGRELLDAHFRPTARVGEGQTLAGRGATAMMDVSDGLSLDLSRLCRESGVGAIVHLTEVPVAAGLTQLADVAPVDPVRLALEGGEDYELLATMPVDRVAGATDLLSERFGTALTVIGEVREGEGLVARDRDGAELPLEPRGWDHFGR